MCSRGVYQLKRLSIFFCDWGGSSTGIRNLLLSQRFEKFRKDNPHIQFEFIRKRNHHPYVSSTYINGYIKDVPLRSLPEEEIIDQFNNIKNSFGRSSVSVTGKRVSGVKESLQGKWYANMWNSYPRVEMEIDRFIPRPTVEYEQVQLRNRENLHEVDYSNLVMKSKMTKNIKLLHR